MFLSVGDRQRRHSGLGTSLPLEVASNTLSHSCTTHVELSWKKKNTKINLPCFLAVVQLMRRWPGAQRGNTKEAGGGRKHSVRGNSTVISSCGGCVRLGSVSPGSRPQKTRRGVAKPASLKLAALRLTPEGGFATWPWSADQSPLLSPSCAGN